MADIHYPQHLVLLLSIDMQTRPTPVPEAVMNLAETSMAHFECYHCGITATIVVTEAGARAWQDHMDLHGPEAPYGCWTWTVQQLPFTDQESSRSS